MAAGLSESADPQVRRVGRPCETFLSETKQNGSLEKQYWGPGGWGSNWLRWLTGDLHFCCYLLCFLHGRRPRRPGPQNATAEPAPCAETWLPNTLRATKPRPRRSPEHFSVPPEPLWNPFEPDFGSRRSPEAFSVPVEPLRILLNLNFAPGALKHRSIFPHTSLSTFAKCSPFPTHLSHYVSVHYGFFLPSSS